MDNLLSVSRSIFTEGERFTTLSLDISRTKLSALERPLTSSKQQHKTSGNLHLKVAKKASASFKECKPYNVIARSRPN